MDIGNNAIARRAIGWWQMGNVMDNHSNIERNIGGGSARNFNRKKVFGGGSAHNFNQIKVFGEGLAEYFYLEKCASNGQIHWAYCLWETGKGSALRD